MIGFCPLASGSKGNSIYLGTKSTRVLIDAGISAAATLKHLSEIGVEAESIQAILVTHEHSDHIAAVATLSDKLKIPVLANADTAKGIVASLGVRPRFKIFTTGELFEFGDLEVHPFSISHDTLDPVAFAIWTGGLKLGFCTDLGVVTSLVKKALEGCDYLYLEANHQVSMVHSSSRPAMLKKRILGKQGHLSNEESARLLVDLHHAGLKHVHLAHLSGECNTPEVALKVVGETLLEKGMQVDLSVALQERRGKAILF
jgi:phosphoribosyl 1,2-cyclic phosphodiesterase